MAPRYCYILHAISSLEYVRAAAHASHKVASAPTSNSRKPKNASVKAEKSAVGGGGRFLSIGAGTAVCAAAHYGEHSVAFATVLMATAIIVFHLICNHNGDGKKSWGVGANDPSSEANCSRSLLRQFRLIFEDLLSLFWISLGFSHLLLLACGSESIMQTDGQGHSIFVIMICWVCDTGALFAGKLNVKVAALFTSSSSSSFSSSKPDIVAQMLGISLQRISGLRTVSRNKTFTGFFGGIASAQLHPQSLHSLRWGWTAAIARAGSKLKKCSCSIASCFCWNSRFPAGQSKPGWLSAFWYRFWLWWETSSSRA